MVARGVTAVVSTAYMDEAERFDRVALLHRGRLLAVETPAVLQQALDDRVLELRSDRVRAARVAALALPGVTHATAFGDRLHLAVGSARRDLPAIVEGLRQQGFAVHDARPIAPSMEDVFVARLGEGTAA
jgi:ABC-2 type transport system ATP-binding protein